MEPLSFTAQLVNIITAGLFYALILSIPVYILLLLIKALRKIANGTEKIEQELGKLREEVKAVREQLSPKLHQ